MRHFKLDCNTSFSKVLETQVSLTIDTIETHEAVLLKIKPHRNIVIQKQNRKKQRKLERKKLQ